MAYDPAYHREYYQANKAKKREQGKAWEARNIDKVRERKRVLAKRRSDLGLTKAAADRYANTHRDRVLLKAARNRAEKQGIPFEIDITDVVIPTHCPVLGIEISPVRGRMNPASPSLDKIDPALGYVKGNVWVISWRANRMKSDASPEELRRFCEGMLRALDKG